MMKLNKKICKVFAVAMTIISLVNVTVNAEMKQSTSKISDASVMRVIETDKNATEELQRMIDSNEIEPAWIIGTTSVYTYIIRSGNTSSCELYIGWKGELQVKMYSFDNYRIYDVDNGTTYSNIGGYTIMCSGAKIGSAKVLDITIPTSETQVNAAVTNPSVYTLSEGWIPQYMTSTSTVTIN